MLQWNLEVGRERAGGWVGLHSSIVRDFICASLCNATYIHLKLLVPISVPTLSHLLKVSELHRLLEESMAAGGAAAAGTPLGA